jgi:hypothetical protein
MTRFTSPFADVAELYLPAGDIPEYAIVRFAGEAEIEAADKSHDPRVAGIMSYSPAVLINSDGDTTGLAVALVGKVPCYVQGPISKGDCVVASDTAGVGQKLDAEKWVPGCVVGKAMQDIYSTDVELIDVAVGRF